MNFTQIAVGLIQAVGGIECDQNIEGVVKVFEGIKIGVNNNWEDHLAAETAEMLMYDEILCKCGQLIEIERNRKTIIAKGTA